MWQRKVSQRRLDCQKRNAILQEDGPTSLAATYAALVFSSLFLPTFLISKFTAKWTMVASMLWEAFQCCREISQHLHDISRSSWYFLGSV